MSEEKPPLTEAIRLLAERERRSLSRHPSPTELSAYHAGTLSEAEETRVREHLALCRQCSDLLLDLAGFADLAPPPGVPELTDAEVEEDWQALRARMGEGATREPEGLNPPAEVVPIRPAKAAEGKRRRDLTPWKVAAAILVAVALFASVRMLKPPAVQGEVVDISDGDRTRGSNQDDLKHITSSQRPRFIFHTLDSYPSYRAEIVAGSTVVWKTTFGADQVPAKPDSALKEVAFLGPEDAPLEPGRYQARLFGVDEPVPIGYIDFEVDEP